MTSDPDAKMLLGLEVCAVKPAYELCASVATPTTTTMVVSTHFLVRFISVRTLTEVSRPPGCPHRYSAGRACT
jgi:hypothetical protein